MKSHFMTCFRSVLYSLFLCKVFSFLKYSHISEISSVTGYSNPPAVRDKILSLRESWPKFAEFIGLSPTEIEAVDRCNESQDQQAYVFMKLFPIPNVKDVECFLDEALQFARKLGYAGEFDLFSVVCNTAMLPHCYTPPF